MSTLRIEPRESTMPTAKGKIFYYPQIFIDGEWRYLDQIGKEVVEISGKVGYAEMKDAQAVIDLYNKQRDSFLERIRKRLNF